MMKLVKAIFSFLFFLITVHTSGQIKSIDGGKGWLLETKSMAYQLMINDNTIAPVFYGPKTSSGITGKMNPQWTNNTRETPVRGWIPRETPGLEVIFPDNVRDLELVFEKAGTETDAAYHTLTIVQKDRHYPLQVISYYRVLPEYDIIERWTEVVHTGRKGTIRLENVQSASLWLPPAAYELTHLPGALRHEFQPQRTQLTQGLKTIYTRDFKSYGSSYFAVRPEGESAETEGEVWYGQLHYSGNWKVDFDKLSDGSLQITGGINFWDTWWDLQPGERFTTPTLSFGYTTGGTGAVSQNFAKYTRETILPKERRDQVRPVLYNSWYATEFDVNEAQQLALAKVAKEIGVEMFVIDDGWFKGRVNSEGGLGDWTVDKNKFPNGLNPVIEKFNGLGLDFGIWVEPEMVNPNSDLYRAHPDWVMHFPNRDRTLMRNQLMLNLAREDVYQYLLKSLTALLKDHNIKYLKWDMNRHLTQPGWPGAKPGQQREIRIRYIQNLYRLVDALRQQFPDVWFETCSSGGGRVDLGMLSRMDVAWASDNIDPLDRIFIQYAYLGAFPANTMVSWTGHEDWHKLDYPLDFRFDVAMSGVLGVGDNITKWQPEDVETATNKIARYKDIRELIHNGDLHRLYSPFETNKSALQYVNESKSEAVIFCYNLAEQLTGSTAYPRARQALVLRGLDAAGKYKVENSDQVFAGDYLMTVGIPWPLSGAYTSTTVKITQVTE